MILDEHRFLIAIENIEGDTKETAIAMLEKLKEFQAENEAFFIENEELRKKIKLQEATIAEMTTKILAMQKTATVTTKPSYPKSGKEILITAKFDSDCTKCGERCLEGKKVFWTPGQQGVRHDSC